MDIVEFDEEAHERDEFEIEKLVQEFEDEEPIAHDVYPDTETDSEGEGDGDDEGDGEGGGSHRRRERQRQREKSTWRRGDGRLYKGQSFFNGVAFKECVLDYVLRTGRNLKQYRYDHDKIGFKCDGVDNEGEGCAWHVYASMQAKNSLWKVTVLYDEHSCTPNGRCVMFKVPVIARLFVDKIREEPDYYMPAKIEELIFVQWRIVVSRPQCQAARNNSLRWIETENDEQFSRLQDYAAEIMKSNPNSTVDIETTKNAEGEDVFQSIYISFAAIKKTWKETCRPLIGVDGTFVKGKIKGQILVALGRDADNAIYPIAWAVVQVENTVNWLWFVQKLKEDLELNDGEGYIMVSDRQKGLISAVKQELPKIEHRNCVRHIYANLKKNHGGKKMLKPLIWTLAWSYNEAQYKQNLDKIFVYDSALHRDVLKSEPKSWCRAFYKMGAYCEDVENNSTESFNNTISKAREKAFVPMLECIARLAMARIERRSLKAAGHRGICTPYVTKFFEAEEKYARKCIITRSTNGDYDARLSGCTYRVNLEKRTCTCLKFEICGIPCEHAYGVILVKNRLG